LQLNYGIQGSADTVVVAEVRVMEQGDERI
jgi:hypothetical protein